MLRSDVPFASEFGLSYNLCVWVVPVVTPLTANSPRRTETNMKASEAANADTLVCLWCRREINHDMFKLWYLAESDLLAEGNAYRLTNTGQGLNRVQQVRHYDILLAGSGELCIVNFVFKCSWRTTHSYQTVISSRCLPYSYPLLISDVSPEPAPDCSIQNFEITSHILDDDSVLKRQAKGLC